MLHDRAGCCVVVCGVCAPWGQRGLTGCRAAASHGCVRAAPGKGLPTAWHGTEDHRAPPPAVHPRIPTEQGCRRLCRALPTCGIHAANVATTRYPAQRPFHARHAAMTCGSRQPSVAGSMRRDVCAPCFATSAAGGIREVSHGGSDFPKVARRVCGSAEARPPSALVPAIRLAAAAQGYIPHTQGRY